ncbi:hypothetical protein HMPREF0063_10142 [Aeromicrobium marinum DSM 15272]|uniref:Uncharacterized protein n=1 Tax=Aeromicrobium marinum DSM 15272 TaxID=585531 RepID=E2S7Y5_9ACTN|nr:nucleotidyl transferase AbiEii/AbiGii toxin family protein [Aeromicrobium marinum]EFQ84801.1 hypothetical protein HMPREF0063_10142 [Aeromicrobium marinum DSM 15272]
MSFIGEAMAPVVQGVIEVRALIGQPPVVVGGLAVLSRLLTPYRATVDLDVVDRRMGGSPQLDVLRAAIGTEAVEPSAVLLPTAHGKVRVDVLPVRQVELDQPSDDPGDRLHASAHAWAHDTATDLTIVVERTRGDAVEVTTPVAEPGPLVAMKLQAVMNRSADKQGTDLLDIVRLTFDSATRPVALAQLGGVDEAIAQDIALHVDLWFARKKQQALRSIHRVGGGDVTADDLDLVAELLTAAAARPS